MVTPPDPAGICAASRSSSMQGRLGGAQAQNLGHIPFHQRPAGGHAAVEQVFSGNVVRVDEERRMRDGLARAIEDVAGAAELDERVAIFAERCGERGGDMVGASRDNRNSRRKTGFRASVRSERAHDIGWLVDRRKVGRIEIDGVQQIWNPASVANVVEPRLDRPIELETAIGRRRITEPGGDEIVRTQDGAGAAPGVGFVALHPEQPRRDVLLVGVATGAPVEQRPGRDVR